MERLLIQASTDVTVSKHYWWPGLLQVLMPSHTLTGCSRKRRVTHGLTHVFLSTVHPSSKPMKSSFESKCVCNFLQRRIAQSRPPILPLASGMKALKVWFGRSNNPAGLARGNLQPWFHFHKKYSLIPLGLLRDSSLKTCMIILYIFSWAVGA